MSTLRPPEPQTSFNGHAMSEKGAERLIGLLAGLDRLDQLLALPTHPALSSTSLSFSRFQLRSRVGAGRFGVVFLADDPVLGRPVVVKVPQPTVLADKGLRERFLRESRATAQLEHPGIVSVFEAGEVDGLPYLAAAYIQGPTLRQWRAAHPDPVPADVAARFISTIARAVHHAHERGVLHCDLSPSNVLLRPVDPARADSGQLTDYTPIVADFGLARVLDQDPSLTRTFQVAGTPLYMSPEQTRGDRRNLTSQTDVYTVGVLLYELMVGQPPFDEETQVSLMDQVLTASPPLPRTHIGRVPRDLEAICLKCLEKNPQDRFASMRSLADDLDRFLNGLPVVARPVHGLVRLARWSARNRVATGLLLAALLVVLAALGFGLDRWTSELRAQADLKLKTATEAAATARAEASRSQAEAAEFYSMLERVRLRRLTRSSGWVEANRADLVRLNDRVKPLESDPFRSEATAVVSALDLGPPRSVAAGFHAHRAAYDPTGRMLALGGFARDLLGTGALRLMSSETGDALRTLTFPSDKDWEKRADGRKDGCWSVLFSPDGRWVVAGTRSGSVVVWDLNSLDQEPAARWRHSSASDDPPRPAKDDRITQLAFDDSGLLWSGDDRTAAAWDAVRQWSEVKRLSGYLSRPPSGLQTRAVLVSGQPTSIHPLGEMFVQRESDQTLIVLRGDSHRVGGFALPDDDRADDAAITDFLFNPEGTLLAATAEHAGHLKLWDVAGSRLLAARNLGPGSLHLAFHPDGRELAVVTVEQVLVFPISQPACVDVLAMQPSPLNDADLTADGRYLATVATAPHEGGQAVADVFDLSQPVTAQKQFGRRFAPPPGNSSKRIAIAGDGESFVLPTQAAYVRYSRGEVHDLEGPPATRDIRFTPEGQLWALGASHMTTWPVGGDIVSRSENGLSSLAVGPLGAVVGRNDGAIHWYAPDGQFQRSVRLRTVPITGLAREGSRLVFGTAAGEVAVLDTERLMVSIPHAHADSVWAVAIGPRGWFATGSADRNVRVWNSHGRAVLTLPQTRPVRRLYWSADGNTLTILAEGERGLRRWKLETLKSELVRLGCDPDLP